MATVTTTREVTITTGTTAQTTIINGQTVSVYVGSTSFIFDGGEIQSVSAKTSSVIGSPTVDASFNVVTNRVSVTVKSKSANKSYHCTVTINYVGTEKIKITKSDGTSSTIGISFPTVPGRYKIKAAMDNGTTITSSNYFYRYASNANRTLKLRFGLSDGTSQEVSLTLKPTGETSPVVSARMLQDSGTGYWTLDGDVKNNNSYSVVAQVSVYDLNGVTLRSGSLTMSANSQLGLAKFINVDLGTVADIRLYVAFLSTDGTLSIGDDYDKNFVNTQITVPSVAYSGEWLWGISEWNITFKFNNKNTIPLTAKIYYAEDYGSGTGADILFGEKTLNANSITTVKYYNDEGPYAIYFRIEYYNGTAKVGTTTFGVVGNEDSSTTVGGEA